MLEQRAAVVVRDHHARHRAPRNAIREREHAAQIRRRLGAGGHLRRPHASPRARRAALGALGKAGWKRVALISERNVLIFQPMLAEVAGSALAPLDVVNPLRTFCKNVNVLQGVVQHIDWTKRELTLDGGRFTRNHIVEFKHLVLAMGSMRYGSQRAMAVMARDARQLARDDSTVADESHNVSWRECWHVRHLL